MKVITLTDVRNVVTDNVDDQTADKIMKVIRDYANQEAADKARLACKIITLEQARSRLSNFIDRLDSFRIGMSSMSDDITYFIEVYDEATREFR